MEYKYEIQVLFMEYINVYADSEKEAIQEVKDKVSLMLESQELKVNSFNYEVTNCEESI